MADRNPKAATAVNAIFLQRHLHPLSLCYYLGYTWCSLCCGTICPGHATWFSSIARTPRTLLSKSLCVSFNAIYYLKLNIHRTLERNFVHRLNFLTVASHAANRKGGSGDTGFCLQDTTLTGLKIATPNWVFKFSNIISQQIDKFSFAPSLCANFSASNWVISLQSSIEIYNIYYICMYARYICVFAQSFLLGVALTFIACWLTANRITLNNLQHLILFKPLQSFFVFVYCSCGMWHVAHK